MIIIEKEGMDKESNKGEWLNCDNSHIKVTHWMLLPESLGSEEG